MASPNTVQTVYEAWHGEGINPEYHRKQQVIVRKIWPVLADALEEMIVPLPKWEIAKPGSTEAVSEATIDDEAFDEWAERYGIEDKVAAIREGEAERENGDE